MSNCIQQASYQTKTPSALPERPSSPELQFVNSALASCLLIETTAALLSGPMSSEDEKSRESSPIRFTASRTSSGRSSQGPLSCRSSGPANIIEFVDSQCPNVKSAIQRHTAYHSAAQRREARMRSLRRGSHSRYFEWGRRPLSAMPNTSPSDSAGTGCSSIAPGAIGAFDAQALDIPELESNLRGSPPSVSAPHSRSISPRIPLSAQEEGVIQSYLRQPCITQATHPALEDVVACIRSDDASTQLLIAYCSAALAHNQQITRAANQQRDTAQQYFGRGTNILWNRLRDADHASSDANIQAVLLLVAYTSDFGQPDEVDIHVEALRTMVAQRTQSEEISDPTLRSQLESIEISRKHHLTLEWEHTCEAPMRFPDGFWQKS